MLTPRERDALDFIKAFNANHRYSPTLREIADGIGLKAKSGANRLVSALEDRGYINRIPNRARALEVIVRKVPEMPRDVEVALAAYCAERSVHRDTVIVEAVAAYLGIA